MKKLLLILLALTLAFSSFSLVSCDKEDGKKFIETLKGKTPEEIYELSRTKLKDATSYSVTASQVITMTANGQTLTMNQSVISKINGDNSYVKMTNDYTSSANMEAWYVDGIVYSSMAGVKAKAEISKEKFMEEYMNTDPSESTLLDIPESWFADIKFEADGKGWALNFVVDGEKWSEVLGNVGLGGTISGNVNYKLHFDDDGNIEKLTTTFDMTVSGVKASCVSESIIKIENVTITPPEDADSYQTVVLP
ncbi:MAG: hypothetical protein IJ404_00465 [Clostridia bacterium]|nr:hypothetical protein [Clostridia bacterium]